ncbi:HD-GYP domain-containing protein [Clostridium sp. MB05]
MRLIPLESIRANSYLSKTLYDIEGRVLLNSGSVLTNSLIKKLRSLSITSLYVIDDVSNYEIENIIKPELRKKASELIKSTFDNVSCIDSIKADSEKDDSYLKSIHLLAEDLLNSILSNENVIYYLVDIKNLHLNTYSHSINVALISLVVGISLNLNRDELLNLCIGALLHDIGKAFIEKEIVAKEDPLTYDEFELMKSHCEKGYCYLKDKDFLHNDSKIIILQHHERIDGLGYPKGLIGNQINKLARIVSIADVYDTLTSEKYYIQPMCASDALEYIMSHANTIFDFEMVKVFSRVIVPFPNGTVIRLSNGDLGVVQQTFRNFPLRPNVKIVKSSLKDKEGVTISLIDELSLVICGVEKNISKSY